MFWVWHKRRFRLKCPDHIANSIAYFERFVGNPPVDNCWYASACAPSTAATHGFSRARHNYVGPVVTDRRCRCGHWLLLLTEGVAVDNGCCDWLKVSLCVDSGCCYWLKVSLCVDNGCCDWLKVSLCVDSGCCDWLKVSLCVDSGCCDWLKVSLCVDNGRCDWLKVSPAIPQRAKTVGERQWQTLDTQRPSKQGHVRDKHKPSNRQ